MLNNKGLRDGMCGKSLKRWDQNPWTRNPNSQLPSCCSPAWGEWSERGRMSLSVESNQTTGELIDGRPRSAPALKKKMLHVGERSSLKLQSLEAHLVSHYSVTCRRMTWLCKKKKMASMEKKEKKLFRLGMQKSGF